MTALRRASNFCDVGIAIDDVADPRHVIGAVEEQADAADVDGAARTQHADIGPDRAFRHHRPRRAIDDRLCRRTQARQREFAGLGRIDDRPRQRPEGTQHGILDAHGHAERIEPCDRRGGRRNECGKTSRRACLDVDAHADRRGRPRHVVADLEVADVGVGAHAHVEDGFGRPRVIRRRPEIAEIEAGLRLRLHETLVAVALRQPAQKADVGAALGGRALRLDQVRQGRRRQRRDQILREDRLRDLRVRQHRPRHDLFLQVHQHGGVHAGDLERRAAAVVVVEHLLAADVAVDDGLRNLDADLDPDLHRHERTEQRFLILRADQIPIEAR